MLKLLIRYSAASWQVLHQKPDGWMEEVCTLALPASVSHGALVREAIKQSRAYGYPIEANPEVIIDPMPEPPYDSTDLVLRDLQGRVVATWRHQDGKTTLAPPIVPVEEHLLNISRTDAVALFLDCAGELCLDLLVVRSPQLPQQFVASVPADAR